MEEALDYYEIKNSNENYRTVEDVLKNGYSLSVGEALSGGWKLLKPNIWLFVGMLLLNMLISGAVGNVPYISFIISFFVSTALNAGYNIVSHKIANGERVRVDNFFDGFRNHYWPLVVIGILQTAIILVALIPLIGLGIYFVYQALQDGLTFDIKNIEYIGQSYWVHILMGGLILMVIGIMVTIFLVQSVNLVLFQNLSPVDSVSISYKLTKGKFFTYLGLLLVLGLINILGVLCLFVGLFVTIPLSICSLYYTYELTFRK